MPTSAVAGGVRPTADAEASLARGSIGDRILWRTLSATQFASAASADRIDCAETALALGHSETARIFYELQFITEGFSPSACRRQDGIADRTGLWHAFSAFARPPRSIASDAPDAGLAELRRLLLVPLEPAPATVEISDRSRSSSIAAIMSGQPQTTGHGSPLIEISHLVTNLYRSLREGDAAHIAAALSAVKHHVLDQTGAEFGDHIGGPIAELIAIAIFRQLKAFLLANAQLCFPPFGSPAVFAAASRCEENALGPYFTGVSRLVRRTQDLFGLIALADRGADLARGQREYWVAALGAHLPLEQKVELVDQLGDRGLTIALSSMLAGNGTASPRSDGLLRAIRDAALDNRVPSLAVDAQLALVRRMPTSAREWIVLAEILGTEGSLGAAEAALKVARQQDGTNATAPQRLAALRASDLSAFNVLTGFTSPAWRSTLRARQHASAAVPVQEMSSAAGG